MGDFGVGIERIVDLLGLERNPRSVPGSDSFNVRCPFCVNENGYHLNINSTKDVYKCFRCNSNGGALSLFAKVALNENVNDGNRKKIYVELLKALGETGTVKASTVRTPTERDIYKILPASDEMLDKAYRALLSLPYLALSEEDKKQLLRRGLTEEDIVRNGYASVPSLNHASALIFEQYLKLYDDLNIEAARASIPRLKHVTKAEIALGMKIADDLLAEGITLNNVPGFYRICDKWTMMLEPGILIPARNFQHQITAIQTRRRSNSGLRYMTLSSKGLDSGVTDGITRYHIPVDCPPPSPNTQVLITEGPLKADVAYSLLKRMGHDNVVFIAFQGVNNIRELPAVAKVLHEAGVREVFNAFDMDKLVNLSVMQAGIKMAKIFEQENILVRMLLWSTDYTMRKISAMCDLAVQYSIDIPDCTSVTELFYLLCCQFRDKNINFDFIIDENGNVIYERWNGKEKGIDDHLASLLGIGE